MLAKKRLKFKTFHKKKIKITDKKTFEKTNLKFGNFGLRTLENGIVTKRQIEAARRIITRHTKKVTKLWIRSRLNRQVTAKSQGTRMGSGKGNLTHKVRKIYKGDILFEVNCFKNKIIKNAFSKASLKLPIKTVMISKGR